MAWRARILFLTTILALSVPGSLVMPARAATHDAVLLEEELDIDIHSLDKARERYRQRVQVLTADGVAEFDQALAFHGPEETFLKIQGSVTLPSGKVLKVDRSSIADHPAVEGYVLYSDARVRVLNFPGVVPGAVVEYSYEKEVSNLNHLTRTFNLQETYPARLKSLVVKSPADVPVRFVQSGSSPGPSVEEGTDSVTRRWTVRDVDAFDLEADTLPPADLLPHVTLAFGRFNFSGRSVEAGSWDGIARFYRELAETRTRPTPEVEMEARRLTEGLDDAADKTRRIHAFARDKVNYVAIELGIGGWQPHFSADVLRNQYGDCKDKATLMISMMRAVGLEAWPTLIRTRDTGRLEADLPELAFNHAIVALPQKEGYRFVDPTGETTAFDDLPWVDQGASALVVKPDGTGVFVTTPMLPPEQNRRMFDLSGAIDTAGNLEGRLVLKATGQRMAELASLRDEPLPDRTRKVSVLLGRLLPGSRLTGHDVTLDGDGGALTITFDFKLAGFVTRAGELQVFRPHLLQLPQPASAAGSTGRSQPVFLPYLFRDEVNQRLLLPPGTTLRKVPESASASAPGMAADVRYALSDEAGRQALKVDGFVMVGARELPPAEQAAFQTFATTLSTEWARGVTLVKAP
jgi:transglutaminase-like putative cysteine protease